MVHYGKHIIDPQTGLCEICDRGAIHDQRRGKRTTRQFLYSNQDGKFTYRPNDNDYDYDEPITTHRTTRKPTQSVPSRSRLDTYDEPPHSQRRAPRREQTPPDDSPRRNGRSKVFYEVDDEGQMYPRDEGPSNEPRRRYLVQPSRNDRHHDNQRRALTPPPPKSDAWNARSRHTNNSDSETIDRHSKPRATQPRSHYDSKAEMYYIDAYSRPQTRTYVKYDDSRVPTKTEPKRRQQLEPIERTYYREAEPVVERKVYKKLPSTRNEPEPPAKLYTNNGEKLRLTRKVETIYPSTSDRSPQAKKYTTFYQIDADRHY